MRRNNRSRDYCCVKSKVFSKQCGAGGWWWWSWNTLYRIYIQQSSCSEFNQNEILCDCLYDAKPLLSHFSTKYTNITPHIHHIVLHTYYIHNLLLLLVLSDAWFQFENVNLFQVFYNWFRKAHCYWLIPIHCWIFRMSRTACFAYTFSIVHYVCLKRLIAKLVYTLSLIIFILFTIAKKQNLSL